MDVCLVATTNFTDSGTDVSMDEPTGQPDYLTDTTWLLHLGFSDERDLRYSSTNFRDTGDIIMYVITTISEQHSMVLITKNSLCQ